MRKLIQCIPNFSEGRRHDVIEKIVSPFREQKGVSLLEYRPDADHNRLVVTLVGEPEALKESLIKAARAAMAEIDMNKHQGGHPRVGAIDVIPFVPLRNISMEECVELAHSFGETYFKELGIPVYFYEEAALKPTRKNLENVRKGQYEGVKKEIGANPDRMPDVGDPSLHPTAGITVIGARKPLIAFNINLDTKDLSIAKAIANSVRASKGGLASVKGIGLMLEEKAMVQVSMNVCDFRQNALYRVFEMVKMEAERWGVKVRESEIYGTLPAEALIDSLAYYMQISNFKQDQVVELRLLDLAE